MQHSNKPPGLPEIGPHPVPAQVCARLSQPALAIALYPAAAPPAKHHRLQPGSVALPTDGRPSVSALDTGALCLVLQWPAAPPSPHLTSQVPIAVVPTEEPPTVEPAPLSSGVYAYLVLNHSP